MCVWCKANATAKASTDAKQPPTPDVVDEDDKHFAAPLQASLSRQDHDKDNFCQAHR